jgi:formylglycine-generating enzyme required for sulfatase activity/predicted Ser/Thr protein kinase
MSTSSSPLSESDLDYGPTLRGLRAGLKVFDRYKLIRQLGRGGMGVVWLGHDEKLDLDIALKFLPDNLVGDESALADLRHETRRCMKLHHTNIVHVYDLVDDEATAAIAMEFVDGRPLSALRAEKAARVMDVADVLPLLRQTCEALAYAHETAKVVHHDLKPANLMLTKDGILKIMDFGIASSLSDSMSKHSRVGQQAGGGGGTLPYMSPQQIMGYPPSVADDVYSLGATLYELLTSKPPFFRGDLTRQIESIIPPPVSARRAELGIEGAAPVSKVWEQVIAACLEKDADKRPRSVREMWQRLSETGAPATGAPAGRSDSKSVKPVSTTSASQPPISDLSSPIPRSRKPILITAACVAVIALALTLAPRQKTTEPKAPPQTEASDNAAAARLAQEKADAEAKQKQMAAQIERERQMREAEMKKQATANDFNTASVGDTRVVDLGSGVKLTLCYVPAGSFTMGSPASEADRSDDEDQVQVRITKGYWLAKTECTQAQWRAVMGTEPSYFKGDDLPVEQVSWVDAQAFMEKLNGKNVLSPGWQWSLPTEAQWEYACRAGTTTPYTGELEWMAWYSDNSVSTTHPVGTKSANAWGLHDMHGNVYEWCSDWYADKLPGGTDPTGAASGSNRVDRGGSWYCYGQNCRSANRLRYEPGHRSGNLGFRAASVPVER